MDFILRHPKINFEIAAIIFDIIVVIFSWNHSYRNEKTAKAFKAVTINCLLLTTCEVALPFILELDSSFNLVKSFINSLQFVFSLFTLYSYSRYMQYYTKITMSKLLTLINRIILIINTALILSNPFTHIIDYFDPASNSFINSSGYIYVGYIPAMFFACEALLIYFISFKNLLPREKLALSFIFIMSLIGSFLQPMLHGQLKIIGLFSSFSIFLLYLSLENSDYHSLSLIKEELQEANESARNANKAKSVFLANTSHEIRTPLNAMLGITDIILNTSNEENVLSYANDMKIAGNSLLHIINDVLDISKIEAGKLEILKNKYHFASLIDELNFTYKLKAEEKGLEFIFDVDEDLPDLLIGDEAHLRQILSNILSNAVKFTKSGEVRFSVFGVVKKPEVYFTFIISDTGIGIKDEDLSHLFESFKRADMENNRNIEGTGLGLSIAKQLIDNMDGQISVHSKYGDGSIFTIKIKQQIANDISINEYRKLLITQEKQTNDASSKLDLTDKKILIVDDNDINIKVALAFFKSFNADITTFNDSIEAFRNIQIIKYDYIFLDDYMPKLSGSGLLKRMRSLPNCPNKETPVIVMTANTNIEDRNNYQKLGFNGFLGKPIQNESLEELFKKL